MEFDTRPLYEEDQVLTVYDMTAVLNGFICQYNELPKWRIIKRREMRVAVEMMYALLAWLNKGKKLDGVKAVSK